MRQSQFRIIDLVAAQIIVGAGLPFVWLIRDCWNDPHNGPAQWLPLPLALVFGAVLWFCFKLIKAQEKS